MESTNYVYIAQLTADIVSAFVGNNKVGRTELSALIENIHLALAKAPARVSAPETPNLVPAVPVKKSVTADYIISLEDGRKFKSLKRHIRTHYGLTPDEYRSKWGLPRDYPMVAPNYAEARSALAKSMGLGRKKSSEPVPVKKARKPRKRTAKQAA